MTNIGHMEMSDIETMERRCALRIEQIGSLTDHSSRCAEAMNEPAPQEVAHRQKLDAWEALTLLRTARRGPLSTTMSARLDKLMEAMPTLPEPEPESEPEPEPKLKPEPES